MEQMAAYVDSTGIVTNVIIVAEEAIPETIAVPEGIHPSIGWSYKGNEFIPPAAIPQPTPTQFISDCKTAVGGITAIASNPSLGMWSLTFNATVLANDWVDVQLLIEHALTSNVITQEQYNSIKDAVISNNMHEVKF